jgi:HK97 family phage prohead protease
MATWKVGASRNLPITDTDRAWDGPAAQQRIFVLPEADWKRAHLIYDADATDLRGSYKLPFADVLNGELTAIPAGLRASASRLPQTDAPQAALDEARAVLDGYFEKFNAESERGLERRCYHASKLRAWLIEGQSPVISGYAAVFNRPSEDLGGFVELIQPGAFAETIKTADIRALWQHDPAIVLGRTKNGTLRLEEDAVGLRIEIDAPDTQGGRDAVASIQRGDVDQMSFGFEVVREAWEQGAPVKRTLVELKLFDVSPVTFPAYPQTSVAVRQHIAELSAATGQAPDAAMVTAAQTRARLALKWKEIGLLETYFRQDGEV